MTSRDRRIMKELQDLTEDKDTSGIHAALEHEGSLSTLLGWFYGPPNTPYAGGKYVIRIQLPNEYPFKPPKMKFETRIWHPNVSSQTGVICLDTLNKNWSPVQTIKTALLSVRMLLENPNPTDPQDGEVASMLLNQPERFVEMAHEWAVRHAGAPRQANLDTSRYRSLANPTDGPVDASRYHGYRPELVEQFTSMGFSLDSVVEALEYCRVDHLLTSLPPARMSDVTTRLLGEQQ
ncbi:ubiquitin-conjugating enzyme [Trichoderma longibrachiatum]|uniref:Ubiquitin-conjugating enzyme E2 2 n=1 Tax=Trichoderma longibrachiatum ATCC 18648 TaxID=983965 RepID=A0A2T4BSD8_TRILO|nr:ubiquitin-conjugating enzyme [Trichoderma longibrachiatum ATCC 18648]